MQATNFGGTFDQLSFEFFYEIFTEDASLHVLYHGAKKSKNDQKLKSRGSCLKFGNLGIVSSESTCWGILK